MARHGRPGVPELHVAPHGEYTTKFPSDCTTARSAPSSDGPPAGVHFGVRGGSICGVAWNDANEDGNPEKVFADRNEDGYVDAAAADTDRDGALDTAANNFDGRVDQVQYDPDEDGAIDKTVTDTDFDGVPDTVHYGDPDTNPYARA